MVLRRKADLLITKEDQDTSLLKHLADQSDAVFNDCTDTFNVQETKLTCFRIQFQTELEEVSDKQSQIVSSQIAAVDTAVVSVDEGNRDI